MCLYLSAKPHIVWQNLGKFLAPNLYISRRIRGCALHFCFPIVLKRIYGPGMQKGQFIHICLQALYC